MILSTALFLATAAGAAFFAGYNPDKRRRVRERDMSKDVSDEMRTFRGPANPQALETDFPGVGDMQDPSEKQALSLEPRPTMAESLQSIAVLTGTSETERSEFDTAGDYDQPYPPEVFQPTVNEICPIDGRRVSPAMPQRELGGEFIGFCSRDCLSEWDHLLPEEQHDRLEQVDEINE